MLQQGEKYPYAIIKTNHRGSSSTVEVVQGISRAAKVVEAYNRNLSPEEAKEGWSYYHDRTTAKPDPAPPRRGGPYKSGGYKR